MILLSDNFLKSESCRYRTLLEKYRNFSCSENWVEISRKLQVARKFFKVKYLATQVIRILMNEMKPKRLFLSNAFRIKSVRFHLLSGNTACRLFDNI